MDIETSAPMIAAGEYSDAPSIHPIARRLSQFGIRSIAIIDDVFDRDLPAKTAFPVNQLDHFLAEIFDDDAALEEVERLGFALSDANSVTDDLIKTLWNRREELGALRPYFEASISPTILGHKNELEPLRQCLTDDLQLEVTLAGEQTLLNATSFDIVFLDYNLGTGEPTASHIKNAERRAREIYEQSGQERKPLIILMSNLDVSEDKISAFREESELLGGMFHFEKKANLNNKHRLLLTMGAFAAALPEQFQIQVFQDEVFSASTKAVAKFKAGLKALRMEDYIYIQRLSLQKDGHPLGDYMLWLYASYLSDLLQSDPDLHKAQEKLNQENFTAPEPPSLKTPTGQLAQIYHSVLFDPNIVDVGPHPAVHCEPAIHDISTDPYLQLGDIFVRKGDFDESGKQKLYMIINAPCDLQFSPRGNRKIDKDFALLLICGSLHNLDFPIPISEGQIGIITQMFNHEGKTYRIFWDPERFISVAYREFPEWKKGDARRNPPIQQSTRVARMRLPFVLEIQQSFAGNLTRIGVPVAPPIRYAARAQFLFCSSDGVLKQFTELRPDLVSLRYGIGPNPVVECRLSRDCIWFVSEELSRFAASAPPDGIAPRRMQKLEILATDYGKLMTLLLPFTIDTSNKASIAGLTIKILRNKKPGDSVSSDEAIFWLNIVDDQTSDIGPADSDVPTGDEINDR